MADTMRIVILEDGTIKTETDTISAANHQSAEAFLKDVTILTGAPPLRKRKAGAHSHSHGNVTHVHQHEDQ